MSVCANCKCEGVSGRSTLAHRHDVTVRYAVSLIFRQPFSFPASLDDERLILCTNCDQFLFQLFQLYRHFENLRPKGSLLDSLQFQSPVAVVPPTRVASPDQKNPDRHSYAPLPVNFSPGTAAQLKAHDTFPSDPQPSAKKTDCHHQLFSASAPDPLPQSSLLQIVSKSDAEGVNKGEPSQSVETTELIMKEQEAMQGRKRLSPSLPMDLSPGNRKRKSAVAKTKMVVPKLLACDEGQASTDFSSTISSYRMRPKKSDKGISKNSVYHEIKSAQPNTLEVTCKSPDGGCEKLNRMLRSIASLLTRCNYGTTMQSTWCSLWNLIDGSEIYCKQFVTHNGLSLFLSCFQAFPFKEDLVKNMIGVLNNVAEWKELRPHLITAEILEVLSSLLTSAETNFEVSYLTAGVLSHILSDGFESWNVTLDRSEVMRELETCIRQWDFDSICSRNFGFQTLRPLLNLLTVDISVCQLWSSWTLANILTFLPDTYCPRFEKELGLKLLNPLRQSLNRWVKGYATIAYKEVKRYKSSNKSHVV